MGAAECKGCSTSDPTSDTIKVNTTLLADAGGKTVADTIGQEKEQSVEEQRPQSDAEEQQARETAAEEERQKRQAEEERRKLEAEAEEQACIERGRAEEREHVAHEEQERLAREREAQAAAEEAARTAQELEEQARREQERLAAEQEAAKQRVATFLKARGFAKGIAAPKKSCMKTSYPLHVAVEENSAEMVTALLKCGADRAAKNSAGLTPLALAQKLDKKKGSHSAVLAALA